MEQNMRREQRGDLVYYTCARLAGVRHAFTTKFGGVSTGDCESLNLGWGRGDAPENVTRNYQILTDALDMPFSRVTLTHQVHSDEVSVVTEDMVGMGLHRPMAWDSDAIVTALPNVPLAGFYADCVVTLLYDPVTHTAGVCHTGWRGTAMGLLGKTVDTMARALGTKRDSLVAVMGPSIRQECFETDADVPDAMGARLGACVRPFVATRGGKFHVDLQGINGMLLEQAGLARANIVDSGICTRCCSDEFWSHRATHGKRGVQAGIISL